MRSKDDSLRETLLSLARSTAAQSGVTEINIRDLAKKAGVAIGTVYNYFSCKDDILIALTEEYWRDTLKLVQNEAASGSFCSQLSAAYALIAVRMQSSASMLMASLSNVQPQARAKMGFMQQELHKIIMQMLLSDDKVKGEIWTESFTKNKFVDFAVLNLMAHLRTGVKDISFFIEAVEKILY